MNAKIQFTCPQCSHQMNLPTSAEGKQGKCPGCGEVVTITAPVAETPSGDPLQVATDPLSVATDPLSVATDPLSVATDPLSVATDPLSVTPQDTGADALGLGGMEPVMGDESSPSDPLAPAPLGGVKPPVPTSRESEPAPVKRRGKLLVVAHVLTVVVSVVLSLVLGPMFLSNEETGNGETTSASPAEDGNGKLREEVDLLGESLEEVTAAVAQLDDRLTAASGGNKAVDELATDLEAVKAAVDQIDGRLAAVNNTNQELADQLALLDISKDSNASALTSFENSRRDEDGNMVFINYPDEYILNSADYQFLREMPHLEELYLSGNQVKDSALKFLKGIRNLKTLDLSENPITNSGLADLADFPNLESISLRETAITDAGLVHLKGMENLKSLSLRDTAITNAGVAQLQKALPDCEITNP